jgi:hypothetical protein
MIRAPELSVVAQVTYVSSRQLFMSLEHSNRGQIYHRAIDVRISALYAWIVEAHTTRGRPGSRGGGLHVDCIFVTSVAPLSLSTILSSRNITICSHELTISDLIVISSGEEIGSQSPRLVCVCFAKFRMFGPALIFGVGAHLVTTREKAVGRLIIASTLTMLIPEVSGHLWEPCFGTNELAVQLLDSIGQGRCTRQHVPTDDEWKERRGETPKNLSNNLIVAVRAAQVIDIAL